MPNLAFLKPEEIPADYRDSFLYDQQELGKSGNRQVLKVTRMCSRCPGVYQVSVPNIRGDLRRGRKMRPGKCKTCRGTVITQEGYVWIHQPSHPNAYNGRYVPAHILAMEKHLGRYLDSSVESVHHIDGDKSNNDISNLQLRTRYHGKGQVRVCGDCGSHNIKEVKLN